MRRDPGDAKLDEPVFPHTTWHWLGQCPGPALQRLRHRQTVHVHVSKVPVVVAFVVAGAGQGFFTPLGLKLRVWRCPWLFSGTFKFEFGAKASDYPRTPGRTFLRGWRQGGGVRAPVLADRIKLGTSAKVVDKTADAGYSFEVSAGATKDCAEAIIWYKKALQGDSTAQNNVGTHYGDGSGVIQDEREALAWLKKSADQSDPDGLA